MEQIVEAVKAAIRESGLVKSLGYHDALLPPGLDEETIDQHERRMGITLLDDFRSFYRLLNGTGCPTDPDQGWVRFWALEEWESMLGNPSSQGEQGHSDFCCQSVYAADHCDDSWLYAAQFDSSGGFVFLLLDGGSGAR